jgi:hypothetical protein
LKELQQAEFAAVVVSGPSCRITHLHTPAGWKSWNSSCMLGQPPALTTQSVVHCAWCLHPLPGVWGRGSWRMSNSLAHWGVNRPVGCLTLLHSCTAVAAAGSAPLPGSHARGTASQDSSGAPAAEVGREGGRQGCLPGQLQPCRSRTHAL